MMSVQPFDSRSMHSPKRYVVAFVAIVLIGIAGNARATPSAGVFTFTIAPDGAGNVDVTGSGTINLAGSKSQQGSSGLGSLIFPAADVIQAGPSNSTAVNKSWSSATGPDNFGIGSISGASSGTGNFFSFGYYSGTAGLGLPTGYVSGSFITDTSIYSNTTLAALGLTSGTSYTWRWAAGATTDTVNIIISAVPEPASAGLLGAGALALLARRRRAPHHA